RDHPVADRAGRVVRGLRAGRRDLDRARPAHRATHRGLSMRSRLVRRGAILAWTVLAGLALAVAFDVVRVGGLQAWLAARIPGVVATPPPYEARGMQVYVGGGR